jgi:hypothetical protein
MLLSFRGDFFCSDAKILLAPTARDQLLLVHSRHHTSSTYRRYPPQWFYTMPSHDVFRSLRLLSRSSGGLISGPKQVTVSDSVNC